MNKKPNLKPLKFHNSHLTIAAILNSSIIDLTSLNSSGLYFSTFRTEDFIPHTFDNDIISIEE